MAGLWTENWQLAEQGTTIRSCTIITTTANRTTRGIHDRMPVFLGESDYDRWLDPGFRDITQLKSLLEPAPDDLLKMTAVSKRVNSPHNDDADCIAPVS